MDDMVGRAFYELAAHDDRLDRDLVDAERKVKASAKQGANAYEREYAGASQKVTAGFGSVRNALAGIGIGIGLATVMTFFGSATAAASDLGETVSKTSQIMGKEALPGLEKWAEGAAEAFGQSKRQALDGAATFAIFGKSAGLAGDDLVGFSTELTELSSDFASFFNTSPADAIEAIGAALRGESEPIRRYGVLLDEATLKQRALTLGIISTTTQALTPQQRVLAAQAEILAQSADAQGDFARTSGGLANTQRQLASAMENVTTQIGEYLLPIALKLATFAKDSLLPALESSIPVLVDISGAAINLAQLAIPLLVAALVVKLVTAFRAAQAAGIESATAIKLAWGAAFLGIPLVLEHFRGESQKTLESNASDVDKLTDMYNLFPDSVDSALSRVPRIVKESASRATEEQKAALLAGETKIKAAAEQALADTIWQAAYDAKQMAQQEAAQIPQAMGNAMLQHEKDLTDSVATLITFLETALTPAQERAAAIAFLTSSAYAEALASGKPAAVTYAGELANAALVVLWGATADGTAAGTGVGSAWVTGLNAALARGLTGQTYTWIQKYTRLLKMAGSPDYTHATEAGLGVGKAWVGGIRKSVLREKSSLSGLFTLPAMGRGPNATGVLAALGGPQQALAGAAAGGGTGGTGSVINNGGSSVEYHYHLSVSGQPIVTGNARDAIDALRRLEGLGVRSLGS